MGRKASLQMSLDHHFLDQKIQNPNEVTLEFEALLDYLKQIRGCDLTCYKRPSLMRRFQYRMQKLRIDGYQSYLQYLQGDAEEHFALLNDVFINFTGFFRDRDPWIGLATDVIPRIIDSWRADEVIRVWSAGCSSGPEIYSTLIVLAEALGVEFCLERVRCFATDVDLDALQHAESATYNDLDIIGMPPQLLQKYFNRTKHGYVFDSELRHLVTFEHHNLLKDAPLAAIDLLICRNVLMYFTLEAQKQTLAHFHQSLKNTGFLFLGQAERVISDRQKFLALNHKQRIYIKESELNDNLRVTPKPYQQEGGHTSQTQLHPDFWQSIFASSASDPLIDKLTYLAALIQSASMP